MLTYPFSVLGDFVGTVATLDEQEPILRWNDVKWQDHVVIAKGEYNLKSAISGTEMQTVYQVYRVVASAALIVGFLHPVYPKTEGGAKSLMLIEALGNLGIKVLNAVLNVLDVLPDMPAEVVNALNS